MKPKEFKIGENKFYVKPFGAFTAANMTGELAGVLAPLASVLAPFVPAMKEGQDGTLNIKLDDIELSALAPSLTSAFSGISGDKLERIMKMLLVQHDNIAVLTPYEDEAVRMNIEVADEVFAGETQDMFVLAAYVIMTNFGGFFKKLLARSGSAQSGGSREKKSLPMNDMATST